METEITLKRINLAPCLVINRCGCERENSLCRLCTEYIPRELLTGILQVLPIVVLTEQRRFNWIESLLGAGSVMTCVDQGQHREQPIETLIHGLRAGRVIPGPVQVCDLARNTDQPGIFLLCSFLALVSTMSGYKIVAEWGGEPVAGQTFAPQATGLPVGFVI